MNKYILIATFLLCLLPATVSAHQPRIVESATTTVTDPEVSKAYYGTLVGEPQVFLIHASAPFALYVNVLVPDIRGQKHDVSAVILKDGNVETPLAVLSGAGFAWTKMFEPFGYDSYWQGPEYRAPAAAGDYEIRVWSSNNDSKYSLAIGETEAFTFAETLSTLHIVPLLKRDFFNESPADFIFSPIGAGYVVVMFFLAFIIGWLYRFTLRKYAAQSPRGLTKNIGTSDRLLRAAIAVLLFGWAITTTWNPFLLFFAGFALFEALFSWCGFYAALGKNSCPV